MSEKFEHGRSEDRGVHFGQMPAAGQSLDTANGQKITNSTAVVEGEICSLTWNFNSFPVV